MKFEAIISDISYDVETSEIQHGGYIYMWYL